MKIARRGLAPWMAGLRSSRTFRCSDCLPDSGHEQKRGSCRPASAKAEERGLLRLSPRPRLKTTPVTSTLSAWSGGQPAKTNPPPKVGYRFGRYFRTAATAWSTPATAPKSAMICLTVSLRGLPIRTLPEAQTLLLGALRPRRAQGCYGSRGASMAVRLTSSQPR